jgi:hypothetical protein
VGGPVQGEGDDGRGAGRDGPGCDGGGEFGPFRFLEVSRDAVAGQDCLGQFEPAAGFAGTNPEPQTEELGSVPAAVIRRVRLAGDQSLGTRCRFGTLAGAGLAGVRFAGGPADGTVHGGRFAPARGPGNRRTGPRASPRGSTALAPGPIHSPGCNHLKKFRGPGNFFNVRREVSSLPEAHRAGVLDRRRTGTLEQRKDPGDITGPAAVGR